MPSLPAFMAMIVALSVGAYARNGVWQDEFAVYEDVIAKGTVKARVYNNLGKAYARNAMPEQALKNYLIASKLQPDLAETHLNLGLIYMSFGALDKAKAEFGVALRIKPDYRTAQTFFDIVSRMD
jgi:tetratricopeptide (TPR) repeat protein